MSAWVLTVVILAALPAALFLINRCIYRPLPRTRPGAPARPGVSVLIPARNEAAHIRAAVQAALGCTEVELEVVVMDDHSTDRTAAIVREIAEADARVRLVAAPPLPPGWCGKPHACQALAEHARHRWLVFVDADVQLLPGALGRLVTFMEHRQVQLASGVPHQRLGTFSEHLLLPLIHLVLLGYLPMPLMRLFRHPAFAAGCGQLIAVDAAAYHQAGGHAAIRQTLHDGVRLPRALRAAGFRTDLFDATDAATCRMYHTNGEVWRGLARNATEGLGHPARILPFTVLLLGGQVLPFLGLFAWEHLAPGDRCGVVAAIGCAWLPRWLGVAAFRQSIRSACVHPLGVVGLVAIQWTALIRSWRGHPAVWKGRRYAPAIVPATPRQPAAPFPIP